MRFVIFLFLLLSFVSCIDIFDKKYTFDTNLVFVEGLLTDQDPFFVTIAQSRSTQRTEFQQPIRRAVVELLVGDGARITLTESVSVFGRYEAPAAFRGKVGQSYRLRMRFSDSRIYESTLERLSAPVGISKTDQTLNLKGIADANGIVTASSLDISVDAQDDPQEQNFYQWRTFLYESQRICATCVNGDWNVRNNECNGYRLDPPHNPPYTNDYECDRRCWQVYLDERLNIFSDALTNGKPIAKRLLKKMPFYLENSGALFEIHQLSITPVIYRYYDLIRQQSETAGTLTDVPPSPPVGNIRNINKADEPVLGYFSAAGITKTRLWIDRSQYAGVKYTTMLGGRAPVLDSGDPVTTLPKFFKVSCGSLRGQTPLVPQGWRF